MDTKLQVRIDKGKPVILVADDDQDDRYLMDQAFAPYAGRLTVQYVQNGEAALKALRQMRENKALPCLVILDINMPRLNGKATLASLRQEAGFKKLSVVLFSTSDRGEDAAFAKAWDACLVTKPLSFEGLRKIVGGFVDECEEAAAA